MLYMCVSTKHSLMNLPYVCPYLSIHWSDTPAYTANKYNWLVNASSWRCMPGSINSPDPGGPSLLPRSPPPSPLAETKPCSWSCDPCVPKGDPKDPYTVYFGQAYPSGAATIVNPTTGCWMDYDCRFGKNTIYGPNRTAPKNSANPHSAESGWKSFQFNWPNNFLQSPETWRCNPGDINTKKPGVWMKLKTKM